MDAEELLKDIYSALEAIGKTQRIKDYFLEENIYSQEQIDEMDEFIDTL